MKEASNSSQTGEVYRIGELEISPTEGVLRRSGADVYLRQRTFQVLLYLVRHADRAVPKEELFATLWPETAVTDGSLTQCILEARKALGDDPREPRYIRTLPKVGYRFVGPVEVRIPILGTGTIAEATGLGATPGTPTAETGVRGRVRRRLATGLALAAVIVAVFLAADGRRRSVRRFAGTDRLVLLVLPLENRSRSPDLDWWRDALAEMLATSLSRSPRLVVVGRPQMEAALSAAGRGATGPVALLARALAAGRRLDADLVVSGGFARVGETTRIDLQVHDVASGTFVTGEALTVDPPDRLLVEVDLLAVQVESRLLGADAEAVATAEPAAAGTVNLDAYRHYVQGLRRVEAFENAEAVAAFVRAIELDPEFAAAHARIGFTYVMRWNQAEAGRPHLARAFELAHRLTERDRLGIEAWRAVVDKDFPAAIDSYRRLLASYPAERDGYAALARLLIGEGRGDDALRVIQDGLRMDPQWPELYNVLATAHASRRRVHQALAAARRYVELAPDLANAHDSLGLALQVLGRYEEAEAAYRRALDLNPTFGVAIVHLGNVQFQTGRFQQARESFERYASLERDNVPRGYAAVAAAFGAAGRWPEAWSTFARIGPDPSAVTGLELALRQNDPVRIGAFRAGVERLDATNRGARGPSTLLDWQTAMLAGRERRWADARAACRAVLDAQPVSWTHYVYDDCLAVVLLAAGRWAEAIAAFRDVLAVNPRFPLAHYRMGLAFEGLEQVGNAVAAYGQFLEIWRAADRGVPEVRDAEARVARLSPARR